MKRIEFNTKNMDRGSLARQIGKILGRDTECMERMIVGRGLVL